MIQMTTRRTALAMAGAALGGAALAACGGPQAASSPAVKQSGPIAGKLDVMWSNEQSTIDFLNNDWFPNFKKENPQIDFSLVVVPGSWDDLFQKIQVTSAAGTPPALTRGKDYFTGDMAAMDLVEPLDQYLKGQKDVAPDQYLPAIWGNINYKGKVIGLPLYSFVRPLYYNVALFREAGLMQGDKPVVADTWQDWARMSKQLTQPSKGIWGTQLYNYSGEDGTTAWINY